MLLPGRGGCVEPLTAGRVDVSQTSRRRSARRGRRPARLVLDHERCPCSTVTSGTVKAVDGVTFAIERGETLGLVGESGCGKSTLGRASCGLQPTGGRIVVRGAGHHRCSGNELRAMRRKMQMIFQDPYASLNPRKTVGEIIGEPLASTASVGQAARTARVARAARARRAARDAANRYPHELSGGQRQRVGIARALALDRLHRLRRAGLGARRLDPGPDHQPARGSAARVRADLPVHRARPRGRAAHLRPVAVMYLGKIVEIAPAGRALREPAASVHAGAALGDPDPDPVVERARGRDPCSRGDLPSPANPPSGCRFHPRCPFVQPSAAPTRSRSSANSAGIASPAISQKTSKPGRIKPKQAT